MSKMVKINGSSTEQFKTGILTVAVEDGATRIMPVVSQTTSLADVGHEIMCGFRPEISADGQRLLPLAGGQTC
jgi:hypothetical protein